MWITTPCLYYPDDYDPEDYDNLKTKVKLILGTIYLNHAHICSYNEMTNGSTLIHMSDGNLVESPVKLKAFQAVIDQIEARLDILVSGTN
jgi:hypothetical protein